MERHKAAVLRWRRDDRVRWQNRKPTSRTQPRTHPRGQLGRCAGSSSCASRWTPTILRARNASGPPTKELKSRDKGPLTRLGSPVIAPLNPGQLGPLGLPVFATRLPPDEPRKSCVSFGICPALKPLLGPLTASYATAAVRLIHRRR